MYRECHSLQLPILVDMLLLSLFLCSHVGGTGAIVGCSIIKYFAVCWFRHFSKRTMLLHSLPVKCLYTV